MKVVRVTISRIMFSVGLLTFGQLAVAAVTSPKVSYYPEDFYQAVTSGSRDSELKNEIYNVLAKAHVRTDGHDVLQDNCSSGDRSCYKKVVLGYKQARVVLFGKIHLEKTRDGYGVFDVYCQEMKTREDFKNTPPGPDQIPDAEVMNTEHTWPQSHFSTNFDKEMQKSDMHILYPVLSAANSSRSNLKYGDVVSPVQKPCEQSKRGYTANGGSNVYFEPPANHKGNAARAIFYFSVRYKMKITPDEETSLKAWHNSDPVDEFERKRNDEIYTVQQERNPFIDHPELVDLISDF